MIYKSIEL
jgi:pre-mRNA-processing factor 8